MIHCHYTLKNKGASSSSNAIEEAFLVPQRTIQSKNISFLPLYNLKNLLSPQTTFKGSSDVKGSLWNHLDKNGIVKQLYY